MALLRTLPLTTAMNPPMSVTRLLGTALSLMNGLLGALPLSSLSKEQSTSWLQALLLDGCMKGRTTTMTWLPGSVAQKGAAIR